MNGITSTQGDSVRSRTIRALGFPLRGSGVAGATGQVDHTQFYCRYGAEEPRPSAGKIALEYSATPAGAYSLTVRDVESGIGVGCDSGSNRVIDR